MRHAMKVSLVAVLVVLLSFGQASCNASQVQAYVNLAVNIALQVAQLAGLPTAMANQVSTDLATVNQLVADYSSASAAQKPGVAGKLDAVLSTAQKDLGAILAASHVADTKVQAAVAAGISIAIDALGSIEAIYAQSAPAQAVAAVRVAVPLPQAIVPTKRLSPGALKSQYNSVMHAYPAAQLR